ncbi:MAG: tetratricopeptide repeat protein [Bacteroidota bacterium]|nr:tetratricopeptide repeat protein [Bacteroidota bacterium]
MIEKMEKADSLQNHLEIARIYKSIGYLDKSIYSLYKALKNTGKQPGDDNRADILNKIGIIYRLQGLYPKAIKQHQEAQRIAQEGNLYNTAQESRYYIGLVHRELGNFDKAFDLFYESLKWFKEIDDQEKTAKVLNSIANGYRNFGDNQKALELYKESLGIYRELNDSDHIAMILNNMGIAYKNTQNYQKALDCYYEGLKLDIDNLQLLRMSRKLNNIGAVYIEMGNYEEALEYLNSSMAIKIMMNSEGDIALTNYNLGISYMRQREYIKALECLLKAYNTSKNLGKANLTRLSAEKIAKLYYSKNNYQEAYNYIMVAHEIKDSLYSFNKALQIGKIVNKYNSEEENNDYFLQRAIKQPLFWFLLIFNLLMILILSGIVVSQRKKLSANHSIQQRLKEERKQMEKTLDRAQRQLQSHTLQLYSKARLLNDLHAKLEELQHHVNSSQRASIQKLINNLTLGSDEQLYKEIEILNSETNNLFKKLGEKYSRLTPNERKICELLKLNLSTKEISKITQQSPQSILMSRSRIRKKLQIDRKINLTNFLMDL